eukprot:EG_transcript_11384
MCFGNSESAPSVHTNTLFVHAGSHPDPSTGAVSTPIFQTATFTQEAPGVNKGYLYSRLSNPTRTALEEAIAVIEGAQHCVVFSSGMAAIDAVVRTLRAGDEVIAGTDLYGGTYPLFTSMWAKFGLSFQFVDTGCPELVEERITSNTRLIWIETPSNPLTKVTDIEAIGQIARRHNVLLCVDNTFASPALQHPLALGAHIVVHSVTKYLAGHSDVVQGAVVTDDAALHSELTFIQKTAGAIPGPMDCFLTLRGIRTLGLRMERHCRNAAAVAHFLRDHPDVKAVHWPGFPDHPSYPIAKRQMKDFGGMVSFELLDGSAETAARLATNTKVFALGVSLGGVESLINHPVTMTHTAIPREERLRNGLTDGLLRLSVGIEDAEDLVADLAAAIQAAVGKSTPSPSNEPTAVAE